MAWQVELSNLARKNLEELDPQTARRRLAFLHERVAQLDDPLMHWGRPQRVALGGLLEVPRRRPPDYCPYRGQCSAHPRCEDRPPPRGVPITSPKQINKRSPSCRVGSNHRPGLPGYLSPMFAPPMGSCCGFFGPTSPNNPSRERHRRRREIASGGVRLMPPPLT